MPKLEAIPRFWSTKGMPGVSGQVPVSPGIMGKEGMAWGEAGERVEQLGRNAFEAFRKLDEAAEAEKILNTHYDLQDEFRNAAETFAERTDYEKFDDDLAKEEDRIRSKYEGKLTTRNTRMAFDRTFRTSSGSLKDALLHKKAQIITNNALGAFGRTYGESIKNYIATNDPQVRDYIKSNMELEAEMLVGRGIMKPADRDKLVGTFDAQAEESQIRNIGLADPLKAYGYLMDKSQFTNIDPIKRAQLTEHMEVRIRMEEGRIDKLNTAVQRENQANALNDYAQGALDYDTLMAYRVNDVETGQPGLSDSFFTSMLDRLRYGKDVMTNPKTFATLYLDPDLTRKKVDENAGDLSVQDQRTLLGRILQERREDERDSKALRKQAEIEGRREEVAIKQEERAKASAEKERRNHYTSDARAYMKKAFNELDIKADEGAQMLRVFQGYVDDAKIPPEELVDYAQKVMETRKGGAARQLWNWMFPDKAKSLGGLMEEQKIEKGVTPSKPSPIPSAAGPRKSLDEIFGGKKATTTGPSPM